jgi:UDP-glucose 4-epimerase
MGYDRILVTGGAGFIGSHLIDKLVRKGFEVTVLDNFSTGRIENIKHHLEKEKFRFIESDIRDRNDVEEALEGMDAIFHLAAITSIPYSMKYPKITYEVNVNGTRNLLEACLRSNIERFIYLSTCAVYGEPEYLPVDENHPTNPISPYAKSKLKAEQACMAFQEAYGLKTTIFRPFNIYGPRQRNDSYGGVIANFIERLREGKPPVIYGDGTQTRDFIYVEDVVRAFMTALNRDDAVGRIFNIANGVPTSINQLAQLLIEFFRAEGIKSQHASPRRGDIRHIYANIEEAKLRLGFEPQVSLKEGLSTLIEAEAK